ARGGAPPGAWFLNGRPIPEPDQEGDPVTDASFLILFNGHHEPVEFRLPGTAFGEKWHVTVDTFQNGETRPELHAEDSVNIEARSTLVLISKSPPIPARAGPRAIGNAPLPNPDRQQLSSPGPGPQDQEGELAGLTILAAL